MADMALQTATTTMPPSDNRRCGRRVRWMLASLMHLEITGSVSRVVAVTACKPLLYLVCLEVSAQMTQLRRLVTAPDIQSHVHCSCHCTRT